MARVTRRRFLGAIGAASLAGCASIDRPTTATDAPDSQAAIPTAQRRLPLPMEPTPLGREVRPGGPGKDGIPSIDDPTFASATDVSFLQPGDPVFGVASHGDVKAYPQSILVHHEIVNDRVGGRPVAVTYCPLTGTAMGFERGETTFGVSGMLLNNNLVMYDRASDTLWPQILATAVPGPWNRDPAIESLREIRLHWTTFQQWQARHPDSDVLVRNTGYALNYGSDPYGAYNPPRGYYANGNTIHPPLNPDDRFHPKDVFLGARTPAGAVAFRKATLAEAGSLRGTLGDTPVVAVFDPRLSTGYVYRDPGQRVASVDGDRVELTDGSRYEPGGLPLHPVYAFDAMWFAWIGLYPDSRVYA